MSLNSYLENLENMKSHLDNWLGLSFHWGIVLLYLKADFSSKGQSEDVVRFAQVIVPESHKSFRLEEDAACLHIIASIFLTTSVPICFF